MGGIRRRGGCRSGCRRSSATLGRRGTISVPSQRAPRPLRMLHGLRSTWISRAVMAFRSANGPAVHDQQSCCRDIHSRCGAVFRKMFLHVLCSMRHDTICSISAYNCFNMEQLRNIADVTVFCNTFAMKSDFARDNDSSGHGGDGSLWYLVMYICSLRDISMYCTLTNNIHA